MIWPLPIAPYSVLVIQMRPDDEAQTTVAQHIYDTLGAEGIDVMWDDRKGGAGAKFKDADLVGIPLRIVVGRDAKDDQVEWKPRTGGEAEVIAVAEALERVRAAKALLSPA